MKSTVRAINGPPVSTSRRQGVERTAVRFASPLVDDAGENKTTRCARTAEGTEPPNSTPREGKAGRRRFRLARGDSLYTLLVVQLLVLLAVTVAIVPFLAFHLSTSASFHHRNHFDPEENGLNEKLPALRGVHNIEIDDEDEDDGYDVGEISNSTYEYAVTTAAGDDTFPLIHIVNTRFMQEQSNLVSLGKARLELFKTFCFPTVVSQTIQPRVEVPAGSESYRFLWIIKTDPDLDPGIREDMVELLRPHGNFFLVGTNNNFGTGVRKGSWRGGESGSDILEGTSPIYTGNKSLLEQAHANRQSKIVVETRLDADDGMPSNFLESVQTKAIRYLSGGQPGWNETNVGSIELALSRNVMLEPEQHVQRDDSIPADASGDGDSEQKATWMFWCMSESVNWYPSLSDFFEQKELHNDTRMVFSDYATNPGRLEVDKNNGKVVCLTPGLTLGLSVGESDENVPRYGHYDLIHELAIQTARQQIQLEHPEADDSDYTTCGLDKPVDCVQLVDMRSVRSRTPTSAGMKGLAAKEKHPLPPFAVDEHWNHMKRSFNVSRASALQTNQHLTDHAVEIMQDNLSGQCTTGHSCKHNSKVLLRQMLEAVGGKDAVPPEKKKWKKKKNTAETKQNVRE